MYMLVAHHRAPEWQGEIARESHENLLEAEAKMMHWARFGVDSFCNIPSDIWIESQEGTLLRIWDWRARVSVMPTLSQTAEAAS